MIKETREQVPYLHFGFNRQTIKTHLNFPVKIWQDKVYKEDEYTTPFLVAPSGIVKQESINEYSVEFVSLGTKICQLSFIGVGAKVLQSNQVVIEVEAITWDSKDIFFNNENVTFNSI